MSEDPISSNSLTDNAPSCTVLTTGPWSSAGIDSVLAQKICLAVAQVVAHGYGRVEVTITHHQVQCLYTTISEHLA